MIKNLASKAIEYLKENYTLPNYGILAGGSLANLIWEYKSDNKAIINDIDIFVFEDKIKIEDTYPKLDSNGNVVKKLTIENITHPYEDMLKKNKDSFYQIAKTDQIESINYVYYNSDKEEISNIINAFDFNCTQVGYDLKTNEFLWTKEFEEFINTGKLLCTNLQSPVHSIVRLPKKCEDLNVEFPKNELYLLYYAINCRLPDMNKKYISDKYYSYYIKYEHILSEYVIPRKQPDIEDYIFHNKKVKLDIYSLVPTKSFANNNETNNNFHNYYDLLFYWRHIRDYPNRKVNWDFHNISDYNIQYFDESIDLFDYEVLKDYHVYDNNRILVGKSIKDQVSYLKLMEKKLGKYKTRLILQNIKAKDLNPNDETDLIIMELSIRKISYLESSNKKYDRI